MEPVNFDRAVGYYDQTRGFPPGEEVPIAALIADVGQFTAFSRVIEIGIGTGRIALPLAKHAACIHGVDISGQMMAQLIAKRTIETVFPVQADATRLPYASNNYHAVVAAHVFHLIPDLETTFVELARVLRPDGCLLRCWNYKIGPFDDLYKTWRAHTPEPKRDYRRAEGFLKDAGWRQVGDDHTYSFTFRQSPHAAVDWYRNRVGSATWDLTDQDIDRGVAALEAFIHDRFDDPNQPVLVEERFHVMRYLPPD